MILQFLFEMVGMFNGAKTFKLCIKMHIIQKNTILRDIFMAVYYKLVMKLFHTICTSSNKRQ